MYVSMAFTYMTYTYYIISFLYVIRPVFQPNAIEFLLLLFLNRSFFWSSVATSASFCPFLVHYFCCSYAGDSSVCICIYIYNYTHIYI